MSTKNIEEKEKEKREKREKREKGKEKFVEKLKIFFFFASLFVFEAGIKVKGGERTKKEMKREKKWEEIRKERMRGERERERER